MGTRGPIPKRKDQLRGHRSKAELNGETVTRVGVTRGAPTQGAEQPRGSADWTPSAKKLWKSAGESGQSLLYTASDWQMLHLLMTELSEYQKMPRRSANMFAAIMAGLSNLLLTEGDRRRLQVELAGDEPETTTPGAEEVEKWLSTLTPPTETEASPTSDRSD